MSGSIKASDYSSIFNTNNDSVSSIFGNVSSNNTSNANLLSDYASIKNGSYRKVVKAYYAKNNAAASGTKGADKSESIAESKKLSSVKSDAQDLQKSAEALKDKSLFEKKKITTTNDSGEEVESFDYDRKAIYSALKDFADNYNKVLKSSVEVDDTKSLRTTSWLTGIVKTNSKLLAEAGITIGKDNKLEVDEDALKTANMTTLKTLFQGENSLSEKVATKSGQLENAAKEAINKLAKTYGKKGVFTGALETGSIYDSLF